MKKVFVLLLVLFSIVSAQQPYVLLISFDGFRWDYLDRGITPVMKDMEQNGVRAISLRASYPTKTFPNHLSIITGMYPQNHGIITNGFTDPFSGEYYRLGDTVSVRDAKWYLGEAFWTTAKRQGVKTASYFWPGSELNTPSRSPNYREHYEHKRPYAKRVEGILNWLKKPYEERPHFITLYFDATDTYGHKYGPNSNEINTCVASLDTLLGTIRTGLADAGMKDSVNIIVVADHGMTEVSTEKVVMIDEILADMECKLEGSGPLMLINTEDGKREEIYNKLLNRKEHYRVYKKESLPEYYHFNKHPFIGDIVVVADIGWSLTTKNGFNKMKKYGSKGNHGYEKDHMDMHGIFLAEGPSFKKNYLTGTVWNIDIYPLLCKIFNIYPRNNIDGKLERIEFVLKD